MDNSQFANADDITGVEHLLAVDDDRMKVRRRMVNPVTGFNSIGERFVCRLSDFIIPVQYLPNEMLKFPLVRRLIECGSFERAVRRDDEVPEALMAEFLRLRFMCDFPFWAAVAVRIKRKGGGEDVNFVLNPPQRKLVAVFEEMRRDNKPIRIILLKARQWGGSTCVQIYMAWLQLIHSVGLNSLIIAHQKSASDEIKDMFDRMLASYPDELLCSEMFPSAEEGVRKTENVGRGDSAVRVLSRNCKIKLGTAERPDSCRGGDYNLVHLSEVGLWRDTLGRTAEDIVRSACGGVLLAPLTMIVYESTPNGTGNFFHREYLAASRGESQFRPVFVAWFEIESYTKRLSDKERRELACRLWDNRFGEEATDRSDSGRYLWNLFLEGASLEAIAWYVEERRKYNDHARMASEYPSDEHEAFVHSGAPVFDREDIAVLRRDCISPIRRGEVVATSGDSVSIGNPVFRDMAGGLLSVWAMPDGSVPISDRYVAVVDVGGRTARADWSVVAVLDRASLLSSGRIEVVAQWRGHCDWDILAWNAARIAAFYNNALLVIESNSLESREGTYAGDGSQLPFILHQIRDAYPNIYARSSAIDSVRPAGELKLGFHTNVATKQMVIATLIRAVREKLYVERCDEALNELEAYERRQNGSYGAITGCHDDILMTRAIGLHVALYEMDPPRNISHRTISRRRAGGRYVSDGYDSISSPYLSRAPRPRLPLSEASF